MIELKPCPFCGSKGFLRQESLVQAVYNDRKRYEAAYKKGYEDCEKNYKDLLSRVSMLAEDFYKEMLAQTGIAKRKE